MLELAGGVCLGVMLRYKDKDKDKKAWSSFEVSQPWHVLTSYACHGVCGWHADWVLTRVLTGFFGEVGKGRLGT